MPISSHSRDPELNDHAQAKTLEKTLSELSNLAAVLFLLTASALVAQSAQQHVWKTYTNVRFEYSICYPADLLIPRNEAANSDGRRFTTKDAQLLVYGRHNVLNETLGEALIDASAMLAGPHGRVTYKVLKRRWFVISGVNERFVFFAKTIASHDQFKAFELTYRRSEATTYSPLVERISSCFTDLAR
jgi:hypothetical protein